MRTGVPALANSPRLASSTAATKVTSTTLANSPRDLLEDKQLRAREWYRQVELPAANGSVTFPGPPYRFSALDWAIRRPPPELGEHNAEILIGELGLTQEQLAILSEAGII